MTARKAKRQVMLVEWQERVMACRSIGQTVRAWCKGQGISSKTYYRWEREVLRMASEQLAAQEAEPRFAELPASKVQQEDPSSRASLAARVCMGNATLELYEGAGTALAAALCGMLHHAE